MTESELEIMQTGPVMFFKHKTRHPWKGWLNTKFLWLRASRPMHGHLHPSREVHLSLSACLAGCTSTSVSGMRSVRTQRLDLRRMKHPAPGPPRPSVNQLKGLAGSTIACSGGGVAMRMVLLVVGLLNAVCTHVQKSPKGARRPA